MNFRDHSNITKVINTKVMTGQSNFQNFYPQNFSIVPLRYVWKRVAQNKVLYLCFKPCSGSDGSFLEIDEVIIAK